MIAGRMRIGAFDVRVWTGGQGAPLLYLHGFEQHPGDAPFLDRLAARREVIAPEHPGYASSTGGDRLRDIHDLALYYRSFVGHWDRGPVDIVGHGLGGMFAAELAIVAPHLTRRVVLAAPYGLWCDRQPLADPFVLKPDALAKAKWHDPARAGEETSGFDPTAGDSAATVRTLNLTAAARFLWPIPDKGLARRLPYLTAPTLVILGESDGLVPPTYDRVWADALPGVATNRIAGAGHLPMIEAADAFDTLVNDFLG